MASLRRGKTLKSPPMSFSFSLSWAAAVTVFLSSCAMIGQQAEKRRHAEERAAALAVHQAWRAEKGWRANTYRNDPLLATATAENASVEISLSEQRGLLLVNGCIAMDFPVATGKRSHPTPSGEFRIRGKERTYSSNLYGKIVDATGGVVVADADTRTDAPAEGTTFVGASMPYWMRLTDSGLGMHVGHVPGRPASHGCIRLRPNTAARLFKLLKVGTPVVIAEQAPALRGESSSRNPAEYSSTLGTGIQNQ